MRTTTCPRAQTLVSTSASSLTRSRQTLPLLRPVVPPSGPSRGAGSHEHSAISAYHGGTKATSPTSTSLTRGRLAVSRARHGSQNVASYSSLLAGTAHETRTARMEQAGREPRLACTRTIPSAAARSCSRRYEATERGAIRRSGTTRRTNPRRRL